MFIMELYYKLYVYVYFNKNFVVIFKKQGLW